MAPASLSFLPTCLCIGVLLLGSQGFITMSAAPTPPRACESFDRLQPFEPIPQGQMRSEAGTVEYFDETNQQLRCLGVFVIRIAIDRQGLLLPRYCDDGALAFVQEGSGFVGFTFPGCPEEYYRFRQGDIVALPPGVPFWFYNDGNKPAELIIIFDINNDADQIESQHMEFVLAGSSRDRSDSKGKLRHVGGPNIFSGFTDDELLAESLGIDKRLAGSLRGEDGRAGGTIVHAPQIRLPPIGPADGKNKDDPMCRIMNRKVIMNLEDPAAAGVHDDPRYQNVTRLTARNFPILESLRLSPERGTVSQNAIVAPHYNINSQDVVLLTRGSVRVQVVDNDGVAVFDGELRQGQLLVIPQYYVVLRKAGADGYEYILFRTNANPLIINMAGPGSVLLALPVDVIAASYNVSTTDAKKIKNSGSNEEPI